MTSIETSSIQKQQKTAITPTRADNYAEWYQQVIRAADLAENSPVRGCMTIKPWGYAVWEKMQARLDKKFKDTGHKNAYFPLLIPLSYLQKEADHIAGFAKECAVVTHHRLTQNSDGKLIPDGALEEPYVIRPTSETIIGEAFSRWIQSYRDLPLLINQWANVMRWEMRTRLFLRTSEFLWQEGHTAHATAEEALAETLKMLDVYADFAETYLAIPVIKGEKSESERFPGADNTYCIEAMMQDKKALQAGTSHFLGQHFSKSCNIRYLSKEGKEEFAWTSSWGVSTRLIGALIMTHSDDDGFVLPPRIAETHVVIMPIIRDEADRTRIMAYCEEIAASLRERQYHEITIGVEIDARDMTGGEKSWQWIKKGVPLRMEIGKKECEANTVFFGRRDKTAKDRLSINKNEFVQQSVVILDEIQANYFNRAKKFLIDNTVVIDSKEAFYQFFAKDSGGFALAHWNGSAKVEAEIKEKLGVTIRCMPFDGEKKPGICIFTGEASACRVIFAKSY